MSKTTFLPSNLILNSTISILTGTENLQFPLNNLKHDFSTKVFRSSTATCEILIDLQTAQPIDFVCLRGNFIDGLGVSSASIIGSQTQVFSGSPTTINLSHKHSFGFVKLPIESFRYYKLILEGVGYCELSNLFIGKSIQMEDNNIAMGFKYSINTLSSVSKNQYGQRFIDTYGSQKLLSGDIKLCNATEFDQLQDIQINNGEIIPLWFILDENGEILTDESKFEFSGMFYMKDLTWSQIAPGLWDTSIILEGCK